MNSYSFVRRLASILALAGICAALLSLRPRPPQSVPILHACNMFVSQVSPTATPALRRGENGLDLVISFTPQQDEEADSITDAVETGTRKLVIYPGKQTVDAVGIENRDLVIAVKSRKNAQELLRLLCFSRPDELSDATAIPE
ncbi:hypothetical protein [Massilia antarctica]|uniref:hypothetical protein n=1 Tax=Massilia antarctica TaxID=2765360 RepID=UPI0011AEFEC1|nr:hypothetical protein [Massilia sp. H27-R4]MCY0910817.1 hypothetical protein [Massilia sp. H27-R4]